MFEFDFATSILYLFKIVVRFGKRNLGKKDWEFAIGRLALVLTLRLGLG